MLRAAVLLLAIAGCAPARQVPLPVRTAQRWVAVLVAGDGSLPVFDTATQRMADLLVAAGTPPGDVRRFSAAPAELAKPRVQIASRSRVLEAIAALHPGPGEACFVFVTSHGAHGPGVYLAPREEFLSPADLDTALQTGCGDAPTVAIVSACYTGGFAQPPMTAPNRVVLTAARADRPSFGCGAGRALAYYDQCLLNQLSQAPSPWTGVVMAANACVAGLEASQREAPSEPQSWIGPAVTALPSVGG